MGVFRKVLSAFFFLVSFLPLTVTAQEMLDDAPHVRMSIYADQTAVVPGEMFHLAIKHDIDEHWHTYWINPGDSGTPTNFTLTMPDGFIQGDISWPAPKVIPYGPLVNHGHEGEVIYTYPIQVPADYAGDTVTIEVLGEWLVCQEICIPENDTQTITLPVSATSEPAHQDLFARALASYPDTRHGMSASYAYDDKVFTLSLTNTNVLTPNGQMHFFPIEWGVILNTAEQKIGASDDNSLTIAIDRDTRDISALNEINGVLINDGKAYQISAKKSEAQAILPITEPSQDSTVLTPTKTEVESSLTLTTALLFAFLGGIILNLMPCVFPVLSMKALSLVKLQGKEKSHAFLHGLSYTAGIILTFVLIASALIILQNAGQQIGWGFQLQNPIVTGLLAYILFIVGLNLAGFFDFAGGFAGVGQSLTQKEGIKGSFFTGVLATLVATPCTAPFMATALGFALTQPALVSIGIFSALGLGLAFPYLLLTVIPGLQHILPKPGVWMDQFKQFLSFPLFLSALWLAWVFAQQSSMTGLTCLIAGAIFLALAIWLWKHRPRKNPVLRLIVWIMMVASFGWALLVPFTYTMMVSNTPTQASDTEKNYSAYTPATLENALSGNTAVFVNMTAAWCITCKVNEQVALNHHSVKTAISDNNIAYLKGDWTSMDSSITQYLKSFGRNGVPLYVYYPAPDASGNRAEPEVLPQILTPDIVLDVFQNK